MSPCPVCEAHSADLGRPSAARWRGPDGNEYCSMHFINRFGHSEPLVRIADFVAPKEPKPPAPRRGKETANVAER